MLDNKTIQYKRHVPLSRHSNYKIGGAANFFYEARSVEEVLAVVSLAGKAGAPVFVLGGGTNVLFPDRGFEGFVLKVAHPTLQLLHNDVVRVGAGVSMQELLDFVISRGLTGLEWAGGLPGTVGGAVRGNAGAFGGEIKDVVLEVLSVDTSGKKPRLIRRKNDECAFSYRNSVFKALRGREIVLEVVLGLSRGDSGDIRDKIEDKINYRKERHPIEYPNVGSIFKNVPFDFFSEDVQKSVEHVLKTDPFPVIPTAYLLSEAGVKGVTAGGAMISPKHPNFIVNCLTASSEDVKSLIAYAKHTVNEKYGVTLEEEVEHAGHW